MKIVSVILARGGSKGIPNKNTIELMNSFIKVSKKNDVNLSKERNGH